MPYYAVAKGRKTGIYNNWNECQNQVNKFPNAKFKKFNSREEANSFVNGNKPQSNEIKTNHIIALAWQINKPVRVDSKPKPNATGPFIEKIFVDGACRNNGMTKRAPSGYGVYYGDQDPRNASVGLHEVDPADKTPTNQRAELHAMKHALSNVFNEVKQSNKKSEIHSDSNYSIQSLNNWSDTWKKNGWKNSKGEPVANVDIIKEAVELKDKINLQYQSKGWDPIKFVHVKGHAGIHGNEEADKLANVGADKMFRNK